jgi:O-antigen/teichoic acid export membrane protein
MWTGVSQLAPSVVGLLLTPVFLARLGVDAYGIWALALSMLTVMGAVDGGVGTALVRFFGMHRVRGDRLASTQLAVTSIGFSILVGVVATVFTTTLGPAIVDLLHVPAGLVDDAGAAVALTGPLVGLAFLSNVPMAVLQAHERFRTMSIINSVATVLYAVSGLALTAHAASPRALLLALSVRLLAVTAGGFACSFRVLRFHGRLVLPIAAVRELLRYAWPLQASALLGLVNSQVDAFIVALLLPVRFVGLYAIGFQAAWTARGVALWAMPPVATRLYVAFGEGGRDGAELAFIALNRWWQETVTVLGVVLASSIWFAVPIWVGQPIRSAAFVALGLSVGYAVNITTAAATSYVRAIGHPEVEARYAAVAVVINIVLTVPGALLWGIYGVVAGTVVGTILGTLALPGIARRAGLPEVRKMVTDVPWRRVTIAVALTVTGDLLLFAVVEGRFARAVLLVVAPLVALLVTVVAPQGGVRQMLRVSAPPADGTLPRGT